MTDRTRPEHARPDVALLAERLKERIYAALTVVAVPLTTALYVSVAVDTASLFVWGLASGRRMGSGWPVALLAGLVNLLIGVIVIGIKLGAGH